VIAGLAISLSACSSASPDTESIDSPASTSTACELTPSGAASDGITVTGDFGAKPTVEFETPLTTETTERTVITEGDGDQALSGNTVDIDFTLYNATDGKELTATNYDSENYAQFVIDEVNYLPGLAKTLACSTAGSRVVGVIPPADSWDSAGQADLGVAATDSIVFVADLVSVVPPIAVEAYADMDDMPAVEFADDGTPTVTIPEGVDAPENTRIGVITEGDGDVVESGATVSVNYLGVLWDGGTEFDSSYARGEPASFATTGVVTGFQAALEGQKVGSTVVAVVAPRDGYGATGSGDSIPADATLVFVVEILAIEG
jgi:peptidylprolyl isomerase